MGDPEDKDDKHADDLARLPSLFKEWQGIVVVLGGAVAAVLAVLLPGQTPAAVQVIGYTVAVALVVVGALIFVRVRRRQRSRQLRERWREKWEQEAAGAHMTAFRGLFPYQEGDVLPGEHRQLEARRLVTQFSEPTFSFGVVCGDSGCGKTSLLRSAIQSRLKAAGEERGFGVLYLGSPRELADDGARDRIVLDEEFAATLASDLGEGGFVRPPELQLVCAALLGNMTLAEYRLAGGARGILSHHVEDAIEVSGDADTGRRVLRALCDFPAHAKRNPQPVAEIAGAVGAEGAQSLALVRTTLRRFEVARLVVSERSGASKERRGAEKSERGGEETGYALVHDYLVDAVSKATSDVSTRDEEANQLLDYYVSEYRTDPKTRIPYRRLRFIRKYADPQRLADPTAHHLLRASVVRLVTSTAAFAALVLITTTLLVAVTTTGHVWHQSVVGSHWEGSDSGPLGLYAQERRNLFITDGSYLGKKNESVKLWDLRTGRLVHSLKRERISRADPDYILGYSENESAVTALHIPTLRESLTALPKEFLTTAPNLPTANIYVSKSGAVIALRRYAVGMADWMAESIRVFSLAENRLLGEVPSCDSHPGLFHYITNDGEYLLAPCHVGGAYVPTILSVRTKERKILARPGYKPLAVYDFNERSSRFAALETSPNGRVALTVWDIRTGRVLDEPSVLNIRADKETPACGVRFTPDGEFIYVDCAAPGQSGERIFELFRINGLRRVTMVPESGVRVIRDVPQFGVVPGDFHAVIVWPDASGETQVWDLTEPEPKSVAGLTLPEIIPPYQNILLNDSGSRAILFLAQKELVEFWDFKVGKKLKTLNIPGRFNKVDFTIGGNAVSVNVEGGTVSLFRADNGEKITDDIRNIGGSEQAIFYDEKCRRAHVWTNEGRVLRYTEGWHLFGRESWFWPAEKCEAQ